MKRARRQDGRIEFLSGTLDMLVLQTLRWGPRHGYGIAQAIRDGSGSTLQVEAGSLYPALHRLVKRGWITAGWKLSENRQRARYYRLTAAGRRQLTSEQSRWGRFVEAVAALMHPRDSQA